MKKACRYTCDICEINFETLDRFSVHLASRGHLICNLQNINNVSNDIYLDQEVDIALYNDAESMEVSPQILLDDCEVQNNTQFKSVGERSEEMDPFCDVDSDITDV